MYPADVAVFLTSIQAGSSGRETTTMSLPRSSGMPGPAGWSTNQMYRDEMRHVLACLNGDETPMADLSEGARVLQLALAAKTASRSGTVVDVSRVDVRPQEVAA